jgi:hypothetical protein
MIILDIIGDDSLHVLEESLDDEEVEKYEHQHPLLLCFVNHLRKLFDRELIEEFRVWSVVVLLWFRVAVIHMV